MPYSITTRDGITLRNIPDDVPPDSLELRQRVERIRAESVTKEPGFLDKAIGTGEAALTAITGATGGALGMLGGAIGGLAGAVATGEYGTRAGADRVEQAAAEGAAGLTYAPRTQSGQDQAEAVGRAMQQLIPIMGAAPGIANPAGGLAVARNALRAPAAAVIDRAAQAMPGRAAAPAAAAPAVPAAVVRPAAVVPRAAVVEAATGESPPLVAEGAGRAIPSLDQYVALRKVAAEPMAPEVRGNFLAWVRQNGGLSMAEKLDITGEPGGVRSNPAGIFRRGGASSDDLASRAAAEGYLPPGLAEETAAFVDLVQEAIGGKRVLNFEEQMLKASRDGGDDAAMTRLRAAEDRAKALGIDPAPAKGDARVLEAYLDRHEPALLRSAVDESRVAPSLPPEADALTARAQQLAQDIQDGGRTVAQYEAEIGPLSPVMRKLVGDELGQPVPPVAAAPAVAPAAAPMQPQRAAAVQPKMAGAMSAEKLAQTARAAGEGGIGSAGAAKVLAEQAAPNRATVKAAQRLGIADHLQADHVTTNEAFRQVVAAIKSNPQSKIAMAEREGLLRIAERATELIDDIGGTTDASALNASVKTGLQAIQSALDSKAEALYKKVRDNVPAKAEAPADAALQFVAQRADELGGVGNLSPIERMIARKLQPEDPATVPTYALLDDVRRDVGSAMRKAGQFKDADTGLAKKLYALLSDDQAAVVDKHGMREVYDLARKAVAQRKAVEDDLVALFGRDLDRSIAGGGANGLPGAFSALAKGDSARLGRLLASVPEDLRQQVVASGLATVFRKMATRGDLDFTGFAKWYEGLKRNRQAYAAVMVNLPLSARKQVEALYRVSAGISESLNRRTKTGALTTIKAEMIGTDSLMENLFSVAKRAGAGMATEAITTPIGLPGAGIAGALGSALTKGKPKALAAIDDLIASPEFEQMARAEPGPAKQAAVRRLAFSPAFSRFARAVGNPAELRDREGWVIGAMRPPPPQQQNDRRQPNTVH
jgi:hypothetical protein